MDLDELLGNSPSYPSSPGLRNADDDREMTSSGEWVDKLMVNKQDPFSGLDTWDPTNLNNMNISSDSIYQKYLSPSDPSKFYSDKSFGLFQTNNQFDTAGASDDVDELDAGTSDSSEPDLLWQFNHSKLGSFGNGVSPNVQKPNHKHTKSQEFRYRHRHDQLTLYEYC